MELAAQVQQLIAVLPTLPESKISFACSLINQYSRKRYLSEAQIPWVGKLVAIARGDVPQVQTVGDFTGVVSLFRSASAKLKFPKIRIQVDGAPVVLSVAGERSKAPGSINIAGEGSWNNREWYGRVSPEGRFDPSRTITAEFSRALIPVLNELSSDPIAAVQRYGRLTGHCMFCGLQLTDARSKAAGFGETCSQHWGLHEAWKRAAVNGPVPVAGVL